MKMKKILALILAGTVMCMTVACGNKKNAEGFDTTYEITVVSREDGSGTRGAFVELFGIEQKNEVGEKVDYTTEEAAVTNSTSVMLSTVAGDEYAIGYVSLGSLNDSVKALKVDGADATEENIMAGAYKVARPFNIATKGELSEAAKDFVQFILSADGQKVVSENGYISLGEMPAYEGSMPEGKIVIAGSTSVSPVMEKLKEAYLTVNPSVEIEIQTNDSSTGMAMTSEGTCDIGMASRELKESEIENGLTGTVIATDGIAVIVNHANVLEDITSEQVKNIYIGEAYTWDDIIE